MQNNTSNTFSVNGARNINIPSSNSHYVYWLGQDGNLWANQNGKTFSLGAPHGDAWQNGYAEGSEKSMDSQGTLISDPNPGNPGGQQASNPTDDQFSINAVTNNATTSAEDAAFKRNMIGIYDRQIADINNNLGTLGDQLNNSLANIKGQYDQYKNEQQSSYDAAENDYNNSTKQNQQNLQINRNNITNNASSGLRGLLRVLGSMGAGGSSVARYEAPAMVTNQANQEYSNAGKTYAQNQQGLDTNWGNYKINAENDRKKLEDWYDGQVKTAKQENYEKGQSLLNDLVTAYGNRAQYGGSYGNNINDAYDRIANYRSQINDLGRYTPANYAGVTAVYNAPDLASYNTSNPNLSTTVTGSSTSASSPLLAALQGLAKHKNNSPYAKNAEA